VNKDFAFHLLDVHCLVAANVTALHGSSSGSSSVVVIEQQQQQ